MINIPTISIITTVYNGVEFIEESILSVINQTYKNFEYIIIDAGSNDGTLEIISKYEDKIDKIVSEPDKGIYHGMDKGIKLSNGKYFIIINSDDYLHDNSVLFEVSKEINKDNLDFYFGDIIVMDRYDKSIIKKEYPSLEGIKRSNTIAHMSLLVKKNIYDRLGGYDLSYEIAADYEFTLKMLLDNCTYRKLNIIISCFRKGGYSFMNKKKFYESYQIRSKYKLDHKTKLYLQYLLGKAIYSIIILKHKIVQIF